MILGISLFVLSSLFLFAYKNTKKFSLNTIEINEQKLETKQLLHVLQISDMHLEKLSVTPNELYESLKDKHIDLIALTGDFLDKKRSIPKLIPYLKVFQKLNPQYGTYAVFGNHDYVLKGDDFAQLKQTLEEFGCHTLQNESVTIKVKGKTIQLIGIDNFSTNHSDLPASFQKTTRNDYSLVLTHDPNIVLHMDNYHFDYLLSGHFHGGQIFWPKPYHLVIMGELAKQNIIKGLHYHNGKPFYISEGLGQTALNIRLGSRPEITIHQLSLVKIKTKKQAS
ncbi:metallophosphoesterase [Anaerobacillus sp. MEB173]|uniref:metallophosphoesterase n=1 Tax=Anaerobacillus sp. MEB173 TaxID=3383345 RepID=UPI003F90707D